MIKVNVRAIIPHNGRYVLMGERDADGQESWDLPGGELKPGVDVYDYLRMLVRETIGYEISCLKFYEIVCHVQRRRQGVLPATTFDLVFTSHVESAKVQPAQKLIELLPFEQFEWFAADGKFRENKIMGLLGQYHKKHTALEAKRRMLALTSQDLE